MWLEEEDGNPSVVVYKTKVTNGTLTDNADGTASLSTGGGSVSDTAYDATSWDNVTTVAPSKNAVRDKIESLAGGHDAVTLDANADTLLSLSTQALGLNTQAANKIFAGPAAGAAAVPTFRDLVDNDIPDNITITEVDPTVDTAAEILAIIDNTALDFGTGVLTAAGFSGPLTGNVTGNVSGSSGSCTGNAATATAASTVAVADNESTAENDLIPFIADAGATGNVALESDGDFYYTPSTGKVTATGFVGSLTGNADTVTNGVYTTNNLSVMSATTSAQLYGVLSDETGSASGTPLAVFNQNPTINGAVLTGAIDAGGATSFELPNSDASPSVAGQLRYDTTVAGLTNGALAYYGGDVRYLVDLDTLPSDDDYVVAYDADAGKFYMKAGSATGANTALSNLASVAINTSLLSDTDNTDDLGSGGVGTKRWKDLYLSGNITDNTNTVTVANLKTAYDHSQDNTQAHSDYLINNGDDTSSGSLTLEGGGITLGKNGAGGVTGTLTLRDGANPGTTSTLTYAKWADLEAVNGLVACNGSGDYSAKTIGIANDNIVEMDDADAAISDYAKFTANGLEGRSYAEVKQDLDLEIGIDVQAYDATLTSIALLGTANDKMLYTTSIDTWAETSLTSAGRDILDDANAAAQRTTLGVGTGDSPTFTDLTLSGLTASELSATDANKKLVSLPVASYPSLTEIGYVKGVSSAIQTQLGNKLESGDNIVKQMAIHFILDGSGSAITTGAKSWVRVPFACTLTAWELTVDTSATITIDVWKDTYANYPPDNTDAMPGAGKEPGITAAIKAQDTDITDWVTDDIAAGDYIKINVDANDNATKAYLTLYGNKT